MAIIETMNIGGAIVNIHDDYIKSREESIEILNRVGDMMYRQLRAQHNAKRYKEENQEESNKKEGK